MGNSSYAQLPGGSPSGVELADTFDYHAIHGNLESHTVSPQAMHGRARGGMQVFNSQRRVPGSVCDPCQRKGPGMGKIRKVDPGISGTVNMILTQAQWIMGVVSKEADVLDKEWFGPQGKDPLEVLLQTNDKRQQADLLIKLGGATAEALTHDSTLELVDAPAKVFGDIHGQFRDMLLLFSHFGFPEELGPTFIFNGDWVDRGRHQLEVITVIFALKLAFPEKIVLIRGNHEDPTMNKAMGECGFFKRCLENMGGEELGRKVFQAAHQAFNWLPLCCVIGSDILIVHGGIGEGKWYLEHVAKKKRPLNHDMLNGDHIIWNILWSDPIADEMQSFGSHYSPRDNHEHIMKTFSKDVTKGFLNNNNLTMIIRSHQARPQGCGYEVMHDGKLCRVFSARDYEGFQNDGSVLDITRNPDTEKLFLKPQVLQSITKQNSVKAFMTSQPYTASNDCSVQ